MCLISFTYSNIKAPSFYYPSISYSNACFWCYIDVCFIFLFFLICIIFDQVCIVWVCPTKMREKREKRIKVIKWSENML